jgi:hypothetical protein
MRSLLLLSLLVLLFACSKSRKIVKRIEGTWKVEKMLMNDGSYTYPNEIHVFAKEAYGGKTYASWTKYPSDYSDTVQGSYLVYKSGDLMVLRNDEAVPVQADTCTIDDMDKDMLIIRNNLGVMYFYKQ